MDGRVRTVGFDPVIADKIRKAIEAALPDKRVTEIAAVSAYNIDTDKTTTRVEITLES